MTDYAERVDRTLGDFRRARRALSTPEGVPLELQIPGHGERMAAFLLDILFMGAGVFCLYLVLLFLFFFLFFCLNFLHITAHKRNFLNDFFD